MDLNSFWFGVEIGQIIMYIMILTILSIYNKKQRR
jgi:hypothetical protein